MVDGGGEGGGSWVFGRPLFAMKVLAFYELKQT